MNSVERVQTALRLGQPDRVPVVEFVVDEKVAAGQKARQGEADLFIFAKNNAAQCLSGAIKGDSVCVFVQRQGFDGIHTSHIVADRCDDCTSSRPDCDAVLRKLEGLREICQFFELFGQLGERLFEFDSALLFLFDHLGWGVVHKIRVAEFAAGAIQIDVYFLNLFLQSCSLSVNIDQTLHWHEQAHIAKQRGRGGWWFVPIVECGYRFDAANALQ